MFKQDITTDNPDDSIAIFLSMQGMRPRNYGLKISEYQGEVMELKMKYEANLPRVPLNNLNLKLSFPFLSANSDWYVGLSYYRSVNLTKFRRLAFGVDGNIYITTISDSHITFDGLDMATTDSSYIDAFIGPSILFWFIRPERRFFSSYAGITGAINLSSPQLTLQPFIGTRLFLDMNKAISLEFRYTEYKTNITHYTFNPYGSAERDESEALLTKLNINLGIQIAF